MKITFVPEQPPGGEMAEVTSNIRNELAHFEGRYVNFPSELVVRLETTPFFVTGSASGSDGVSLIEIKYDLLSPHNAEYNYVGNSSPIELPREPEE